MAAVEVRRYDGKLDSFLLRNLPRENYERVSTSEPCVVVSTEDKRVHRHVILGHRSLYLTEFPPKNLKVAVNLRDVTDIKMLDDLPDFLSGKEQEDTVHVQLQCRRTVKEKSLLGGRSPSILKRLKGREQKSVPNSPLISSRTSGGTESGSSGALLDVRPHSSLFFSPTVIAKRSPQFLNDKQQHRRRSLSPIALSNSSTGLNTLQSTSPKYRSSSNSPATTGRSYSLSPASQRLSPGDTRLLNSPQLVNNACISPNGGVRKDISSQQKAAVRFIIGGGAVLKPASSVKSLSSSTDSGSTSSSPDLIEPTTTTTTRQGLLQPSSIADQRYSSSPDVLSLSYPPDSLDKAHSERSLNVLGGSTLSLNSQSAHSCDGLKTETVIIDLYILKHTTDFYHQLYVTFTNVKISETLTATQDGSVPLQVTKTPNRPVDHFSQLYCSLKQELLSSNDLESSAGLAQELCTACQKYFIIKRMFWEDSDLLEFCIAQLSTHLTTQHITSSGSMHWTSSDHLEYSLILMDLIYQMMKETHLFHKKFILLTRNNGQTLLATAKALLLLPLPRSGDREVELFERELTEKATGVLYELVQVSQQARWPLVRKSSVSTSWLVRALAENERMIYFSSRIISYVSTAISSSTLPPSPQSLVTVYHCAYLLSTLVHHSSSIVQAFREHFSEEFRYFIRLSKAQQTLPPSNPLTRNTLERLQAAKSKII